MDEPLFTIKPDCGVPYIPKVDFQFVEDCKIPAAPPPTFDCQPPIPPPPETPPLCPDIRGAITVKTTLLPRSGQSCNTGSDSSGAGGTINVSQTENCEFFIGIDIDIPIPQPPCPLITAKSPKVTIGYEGCIPSSSDSFTVTPKTTCDPNTPCEFELELDLTIPIPKPPCPVIRANTPTVVIGYEGCIPQSSNSFTVTPIPPDPCDSSSACQFELDLTLAIPIPKPPCPVITTKSPKVTVGYEGCIPQSSNSFTVTPIPPDPCSKDGVCEFELALDLTIPIPKPPCPVITTNPPIVTIGYAGCIPNLPNTFTVKPTLPNPCDSSGACEFEFDLNLTIPIPKPPCPVIKTKPPTVTTGYSACVTGLPNTFTVTPTPPSLCDPNKPCEFELELNLVVPIPEPPCPEIYPGHVLVTAVDDSLPVPPSQLIVTKTEVPGTCPNQPKTCQFGIDIEIYVPVPQPVCPSLWVTPGYPIITTGPVGSTPEFLFNIFKSPDPFSPFGRNTDCDWEFRPRITIPAQCKPELEVREATVANGWILLTDGLYRYEEFVTKEEPCKYIIQPYLWLPKGPKVTTGIITAAWKSCGGNPSLDISIEPITAPGAEVVTEYKLNVDLKIPRAPEYTGGTINLHGYGSGTIAVSNTYPDSGSSLTGPYDCNRVITGDITLNTTDCSSSSTMGFTMPPDALPMTEDPDAALIDRLIEKMKYNSQFRRAIKDIVNAPDVPT